MKWNKKGFTLIEVIVSITIIALISTTVIIGLKKGDKKNDKLISNIKSSADVYFNSNELLLNKAKDNYGFLKVSIDELKQNGYLDSNVMLPDVYSSEQSNDKAVIYLEDVDEENTVGLISVTYPYEKNKPFIASLADLYIEKIEIGEFRCNSSTDSNYSFDNIEYLDEDYEKRNSNNYACVFLESEELKSSESEVIEPTTFNESDYKDKVSLAGEDAIVDKEETSNISSTNTESSMQNKKDTLSQKDLSEEDYSNSKLSEIKENSKNYIAYRVKTLNNNYIYAIRTVTINQEPNPTISAYKSNFNDEYKCGSWTNYKDGITLTVKENGIHNSDQSFYRLDNGNKIYDVTDQKVESSGIYGVDYTLKGMISNKSESINVNTCEVKIDTDLPQIKIEESILGNNKVDLVVNISDELSGISGYKVLNYYADVENINWDKNTSNDSTIRIDKKNINRNQTYYVYAKDNAGNISKTSYKMQANEMYPEITYEPIKKSMTKFKVIIKNINSSSDYDLDIDNTKIQYALDWKHTELTGKSKEAYGYDYNFFENYYTYNDANKEYWNVEGHDIPYNRSYNKVNYDKELVSCNEKECSFILDMEDFMKTCGTSCRRAIGYSILNNLKVNYYVYAKNKKGNSIVEKITSKLNVYYDGGAFSNKWYNYDRTHNRLIGINSAGDILFEEYESGRDGRHYIYYHNSKNSTTSSVFWYSGFSATFQTFDEDTISFTLCNTYSITKGSGRRKTTTKYREYYEVNSYINFYGIPNTYPNYFDRATNNGCGTFKTKIKTDQYKSSTSKHIYDSEYSREKEFINSFLSYLKEYERSYTKNPSTYGIDGTVNNYVFSTKKGDTLYNYILVYEKHDKSTHKNKVFFLPEVSLEGKIETRSTISTENSGDAN